MDIEMLRMFLMWCTIINGCLLLFWTVMFKLAPELVYSTQRKWFPISRDTFNVVMYGFLGTFKILFLIFNAVPYIAVVIIG